MSGKLNWRMSQDLNSAVEDGNYEKVERLLAEGGADVNYKGAAYGEALPGGSVPAVIQQPQQRQLDPPPTVHWLLAGVPLHPDPQPSWHVLVHHEGLLLTVIGPWMRDVALPLAGTHPEMKELIFTLISHLYAMCLTNTPIADRFFNEFVKPAAQRKLDTMPAQMHALAQRLEVDYALAPTELRGTPEHKVELNQSQYLAFMHPDHLHVAEEVLAASTDKFVAMRAEAEAAVAEIGTVYACVGRSTTYSQAHVHSLPTPPEVMVAALCILREDYADLDVPWGALMDTVRFSITTTCIDDQANFVKQFLPEGVNLNYSNAAGLPAKKRRVERHVDNSLTVVRAKSTMDDPTAAVKQELWNLLYTPDGLTFATMVGEGGLEEVQGADRWKEYGDVGWGAKLLYPIRNPREPRNTTTTPQPRNPRFQAAVTAAKQANPTISAYVWEPALQLLAHPTFAGQPVAMVIEVQLYLEEFLHFRKLVHCYYKIARAPNLASLAQDCRKYAKNPALAFDTQKQADADLLAAVKAGDADGHDFHTVHKEIAALRKDLTDAQATIAAQQEGVQKDIVGLRKDLTDAQQLIAAQQDLLAALLKPVAVSTAANGKGAGVKCDAVGMPSCNPSVAVVEGGGGGGVEASASQVLAIK
eukprot:gene13154-21276_t